MNKKLYYTVELEIEEWDNGMGETSGFKSIKMYSIDNNTPEIIAELPDVEIQKESTEAIQEYLNDNGLGDESFDFIKL